MQLRSVILPTVYAIVLLHLGHKSVNWFAKDSRLISGRGTLMLTRYMDLNIVRGFTLLFSRILDIAFTKQQFHIKLQQNNIILLDLTARGIYNVKAGVCAVWNCRKSPEYQAWVVASVVPKVVWDITQRTFYGTR